MTLDAAPAPGIAPLWMYVGELLKATSCRTWIGGFGIHIGGVGMERVSHGRGNGWKIVRMGRRVAVRAERKAGDA